MISVIAMAFWLPKTASILSSNSLPRIRAGTTAQANLR